jgi:phage/plasmid-associated DNA primase
VPFTGFFPAGVADPTLLGRLTSQANLQGLLRSAVGGLQQVMRRGMFAVPASVAAATERFKTEADPMRGFIGERIEAVHPNNSPFIPRTDVYNAYTPWATINGFHLMSASRFYESFMAAATDSGISIRTLRIDGVNGYRGIVIN